MRNSLGLVHKFIAEEELEAPADNPSGRSAAKNSLF
jgi:hypothetical protein